MLRLTGKLVIGLCVLSAGCSPTPVPPSLDSPIRPINVEGCRNAQLNLRYLDANNVRGLVNCLNVQTGALQPYKDFLDDIDTEELNQFLMIYNKHINTEGHRLNKTLDLVDRIDKQGWLKPFYKDLQVVLENNVIQAALPLLQNFFEDPARPGQIDPKAQKFSDFLLELMQRDLFTSALISSANTFGGIRAQILAYLMAVDIPQGGLTNSQMANLFSDTLMRSFQDQAFHKVLAHMSDPQMGRSFKRISAEDVRHLAEVMSYFSIGFSQGVSRVERMRQVVNGTDRPLQCYGNQSQFRYADNILKFVAGEASSFASKAESDRFLLKTVPVLLAMSRESCNYHPDLLRNTSFLTEAVVDGYGGGVLAALRYLLHSHRYEELAQSMKSDYLVQLSPFLRDVAMRSGFSFLLEVFSEDLKESDFDHLMKALNFFVANDIRGSELTDWIKRNVPQPSRSVVLTTLAQMPSQRQSFVELGLELANAPGLDDASRAFKGALADHPFPDGHTTRFMEVGQKIFKPDSEKRKDVELFISNLRKSFGDSRGGLGDLLAIAARSTSLSRERPVQDALIGILGDKALIDKIGPIMLKLSRNPKFFKALEFTGTISGNGQLERLLRFLVELFKNSQGPGLTPDPQPPVIYMPPTQTAEQVMANYRPYAPQVPSGSYQDCASLNGSLYDVSGDQLYKGLRCLDADGSVPAAALIAEHLKADGLLPQTADLLRALLVTSPTILGGLNQIERLFRSGQLESLLQLLVISGEPGYQLPYTMDRFLGAGFELPELSQTFEFLGQFLRVGTLHDSLSLSLDLVTKESKPVFKSDTQFKLKVRDPDAIKRKIKEFNPKWTSAQIESSYQKLRTDFEERTDDWYHQNGLFARLTKAQWIEHIYLSARESLRTTDLKEMISALQDITKNFDIVKVLTNAVNDHRLVNNYDRELNRIMRIQTQLDQLEALVQVSDIDIPVGFINHVGTDFQLAIVKANDLSSEMKKQKEKLDLGISVHGIDKRRSFYLRNMRENFPALQEWADNGNLRIFQRVYRALYNATPAQFRDKDDPVNNHMGSLNRANLIGLFDALSLAVPHLLQSGQLEVAVQGFKSLVHQIQPQDIEPLKAVIDAFTTKVQGSGISPLEQMLLRIRQLYETDLTKYDSFKDTLFHLFINASRTRGTMTALLQGLPLVISKPAVFDACLDFLMEDMVNSDGRLMRLGSRLWQSSDGDWERLRALSQIIFEAKTTRGDFALPYAMSVVSHSYNSKTSDFQGWIDRFKQFKQDPRVEAFSPVELIQSSLATMGTESLGFEDGLSEIMLNPTHRETLVKLSRTLAGKEDISKILAIVVQEVKKGHIDEALHFLFDNLKAGTQGLVSNLEQ
ncbi:MAG: hypothetical protein IT289_09115 [Oligoflexia bacterium]|nr:hypothetical protein [Oligoflexia bacterium]